MIIQQIPKVDFGLIRNIFSFDLSMWFGKFPNDLWNLLTEQLSCHFGTADIVALGIVVFHCTECNDYIGCDNYSLFCKGG